MLFDPSEGSVLPPGVVIQPVLNEVQDNVITVGLENHSDENNLFTRKGVYWKLG